VRATQVDSPQRQDRRPAAPQAAHIGNTVGMNVIGKLRGLDDRVLGDRFRGGQAMDEEAAPRKRRGPAALAGVLRVTYRISQLVLVVLALVVFLGIVFTKAPTNAKNTIVSNVLDLARNAAGPFKDVFSPKDKENALVVNYLLAGGVYLVLAYIVRRLPTGKG
jgi:hypothetical protein